MTRESEESARRYCPCCKANTPHLWEGGSSDLDERWRCIGCRAITGDTVNTASHWADPQAAFNRVMEIIRTHVSSQEDAAEADCCAEAVQVALKVLAYSPPANNDDILAASQLDPDDPRHELLQARQAFWLLDQLLHRTRAERDEAPDRQRLDKLEALAEPGLAWIARHSVLGRGYRLHQLAATEGEGYATAREAIDAVPEPEGSP